MKKIIATHPHYGQMYAMHCHSDWAVRPGRTDAKFRDRSTAILLDSFKPACGYSTYWFAFKRPTEIGFVHVDIRDLVPNCSQQVNAFPMEPALKMEAMRDLLTAHLPSAAELYRLAELHGLIADNSNNELRYS